ncbi:omptin family outer membrane protease [Escherichia fergusonii]|nr:omptin family outer membrane protease [Escherichia fergusonii]QMI43821.1 omptin family outer membrane protease [Escherichia fergusonii]
MKPRIISGDFPRGPKGIGYQQKFSASWLGLAGKYSPWAEGKFRCFL